MIKEVKESSLIAKNRKAYFDYEIVEEYEAGIALTGSEVKSLRVNNCDITAAYADVRLEGSSAQVYLINLHIPEFKNAGKFGHQPKAMRKLLLHKREIKKLIGKTAIKGFTLIPLEVYFNKKGLAKIKLGVCRGKTKIDKRETIKEREWKKDKARMIKN